MKKLFLTFLISFTCTCSYAQPGKDGALTVTSPNQMLNHYIPISVDINAGSNNVTIANASLFSLCPGDLIMIYQAQGANMDITNTSSYGNITAYNSAGLYEFKYVQSVSGNNITTQTTFTNSYAIAGRAQLIKVPQYTTLTINSGASIQPKPWKDTIISTLPYRFGGLVVLHTTTIINNGTITATDAGFRGGALFNSFGLNTGMTAVRSTLNNQGGEKGESIFGYQLDYDGPNGGRYCFGAPANAGGGGNGHNAGGGGGANGNNGNAWSGQGIMIVNANNLLAAWALSAGYAANGNALTNSSGGGHGGYSYGDANANATIQGPGNPAWIGDTRREVGGIGGRPLTNINSETRIYFGGGGGAPHSDNNATPPATNGGGIVYLISTGITGTGIISSNGLNVGNSSGCNCDGLAGAGAGGSIIIKSGAISTSQNVSAFGGNGGNQMFPVSPSNPNESEGPGGGGGGGFVAISSGAIIPVINGGSNGTSLSNAVANEMTSNGSTQGATGQTAPVSTAFITYIPITPPPTSGSTITACTGAVLNLTTTAGASTYFWSGPNSFTSSVQNPTIINAQTNASGIYTVTQTFSGCQPFASYTTNVVINLPPVASITNTTSSICNGQSLNFSGNGGTSYSWSGPNGFNSTSQNPVINSATSANNGSYTLIVTAAAGCTASAVSAPVAVASVPTVSAIGSNVCVNQTANINANSAGSTFFWNGPNGFSSASQNINFSNATFSLSGIYNLTVTSAQGCTNTAAVSVSVYPLPTPTLASNSPVCAGAELNLTGGGGLTYQYLGPNGFSSNQQNTSITNVTYAAAGIYTLTATNFACSASATLAVVIFGSGTGTIMVSNNEKCVPFCSSFSVNTNGSPIVSTSLTVNGQLFIGNNASFCITQPGNYIVNSVFKDNDGCINSSSISVTGYPIPNADFVSSPIKPIEGIDEVLFTNTSTGINQTSWNWFFNDNNGFTSSNQNTFYLFETAGNYPVAMIVTNEWGCSDTIVKVITVGEDFAFYIPNTFTPNGDGLNDIFLPKGHGIKNYSMEIFDRWGEKIFTTKEFSVGWDGTFKGKKCEIDTYTWKINLSDPAGRAKQFTGHVNIIE